MHAYTWFALVMGFTWVFSLFHVDVLDGFNAPAAATNLSCRKMAVVPPVNAAGAGAASAGAGAAVAAAASFDLNMAVYDPG